MLVLGSVYIFSTTNNGVNWSEQQTLVALDGLAGDKFGSGISVSGDFLAVGAPFDSHKGTATGIF